jgi:hypothetical protein
MKIQIIDTITIILLIIFSSTLISAKDLSSGENKFINSNFNELKSLEELPRGLQKYLSENIKGKISPIDGPFQATDVVTDPKVPTRRLILAGKYENTYFIWYEHGGYGYHHHIVVVEEEASNINLIYAARPFNAKSLSDIRELIISGKLSDETQEVQKHRYW